MGVDHLIPADAYTQVIARVIEAAGVPERNARLAAGILADADLRGVHSHGVRLLFGNLKRMAGGAINPRAVPEEVVCFGNVTILDAHQAFGPVAGALAMERAIAHAREHTLGYVIVRNSNHYGSAGSFAMMAVREGFMAIATSVCGPTMAIHGGVERLIGTNPICVAVPGPEHPILFDMATSTAAIGKVGVLRKQGIELPAEWFADRDVNTPPNVLAPVGGPKGSGLALMLEILNGALAGGAVLSQMKPEDPSVDPDRGTHTMIVIDHTKLIAPADYEASMRRLITELKGARREPGVEEILLPGERSWRTMQERLRNGVPVSEDTVAALEQAAKDLGATIDWPW